MVGTIGPVVHGRRRSLKFVATIFAFMHLAGAAVTGLCVSLLGRLAGCQVGQGTIALLLFLAVLASIRELGLYRFALPSSSWQVPKHWLRFPVEVVALLYGFFLGLAVTTRVLHATLYVGLAAIVILADVPLGVTGMVLYGLARAVAVLLAVFRNPTPDLAHHFICTSGRNARMVAVINGVALAAFATELGISLATR